MGNVPRTENNEPRKPSPEELSEINRQLTFVENSLGAKKAATHEMINENRQPNKRSYEELGVTNPELAVASASSDKTDSRDIEHLARTANNSSAKNRKMGTDALKIHIKKWLQIKFKGRKYQK